MFIHLKNMLGLSLSKPDYKSDNERDDQQPEISELSALNDIDEERTDVLSD